MLDKLREQWAAAPLWQRILLLIIFPAVIVGILWFYTVKPAIEERERLKQEKAKLEQEVKRYRTLVRPEVLEGLKKQIEQLEEEIRRKEEELERVVGRIPARKDLERIFGEVNRLAGMRDLVMTKITISRPKVQRLRLVEKEGKKVVEVVSAEQPRRQVRRPPQRRPQPQQRPQGIPITTVEIAMTLEGKTLNIQRFLQDLYARGIVSYPKSVKIEPVRQEEKVKAEVVIDVILRR